MKFILSIFIVAVLGYYFYHSRKSDFDALANRLANINCAGGLMKIYKFEDDEVRKVQASLPDVKTRTIGQGMPAAEAIVASIQRILVAANERLSPKDIAAMKNFNKNDAAQKKKLALATFRKMGATCGVTFTKLDVEGELGLLLQAAGQGKL